MVSSVFLIEMEEPTGSDCCHFGGLGSSQIITELYETLRFRLLDTKIAITVSPTLRRNDLHYPKSQPEQQPSMVLLFWQAFFPSLVYMNGQRTAVFQHATYVLFYVLHHGSR